MKILITGVAGFIGAALAKKLIDNDNHIVGIDNLNSYYDINLKKDRLKSIFKKKNRKGVFTFIEADISDNQLTDIFAKYNFDIVINLAAQAGVRYSLENPRVYVESNLVGFANLLELCRKFNIKNFIYASSSSVYGDNKLFPFSELHNVDHPISLYAATKKSNELLAHSYSHLFDIPSTGLRFFTVYGPWGRPDMAPMIFAKALLLNKKIKVFNNGEMLRDFTFIDDVVEAVLKCCYKPATSNDNFDKLNPDPSSSFAPHRIFNVGNNMPIKLLDFIKTLEKHFNKKANLEFYPLQPGDVIKTGADTKLLEDWICYCPSTSLDEGIKLFKDWYTNYY
tara:strand:- start:9479 stop:10489 length:1011 start_codon:yes stop_codon:yes gene_type:complete